jgi:hypothetical protein
VHTTPRRRQPIRATSLRARSVLGRIANASHWPTGARLDRADVATQHFLVANPQSRRAAPLPSPALRSSTSTNLVDVAVVSLHPTRCLPCQKSLRPCSPREPDSIEPTLQPRSASSTTPPPCLPLPALHVEPTGLHHQHQPRRPAPLPLPAPRSSTSTHLVTSANPVDVDVVRLHPIRYQSWHNDLSPAAHENET